MSQLISNYQPFDNELVDKTVLITGAAGGLGSALATLCSDYGANLILLDKNEDALNELHDKIEASTGTQPGLYPLDLRGATPEDYKQLAETVEDVFGCLHGLFHCAATLGTISPIDNIDSKVWSDTFSTNLHGPILLTQALLPILQSTENSSIVFTADNKLKAYWGPYGVSKASIKASATIIADELDSKQDENQNFPLTCNVICPGPMKTSLRRTAFPGEDTDSLPEPAEIAPAYLYLLSDEARSINGCEFEL